MLYSFRIIVVWSVRRSRQRWIWQTISESESAITFCNVFGGLLHGVVLPLSVTIYDDDSWYGDGGSLFPLVNIGEAGVVGEIRHTKRTN